MNAAENLITMVNQIGEFFETMPDRQQALADLAEHLKRFWVPRMRRALLEHIERYGDTELKEIVQTAVQTHKALLLQAVMSLSSGGRRGDTSADKFGPNSNAIWVKSIKK
jgi:formate dehydrogenase subunit delta